VWPTAEGDNSGCATKTVRLRHRVDLSDSVSAEFLEPGTEVIPRCENVRDQEAVVPPVGRIELNNYFFSQALRTRGRRTLARLQSTAGTFSSLMTTRSDRSKR